MNVMDMHVLNITLEPESKLLMYSSETNSTHVNFTCVAAEVYPEPKLFLYEAQTQDTYK